MLKMTAKVKSNIGNNQINKVNKNKKKYLAIKKNLKNKMVQEKNGDIKKKMKFKKHVPTPNQKEKSMESDDEVDESENSDDDMEASDDEDVKNESIEASADDDSGEDNENENGDNNIEEDEKKEKPLNHCSKKDVNSTRSDDAYKERTISISNLRGRVSINKIKKIFKDVENGEIKNVYLKTVKLEPLTPKDTLKLELKSLKHGFLAFVIFLNKEGAQNAVKLNGIMFNGRHLFIVSSKRIKEQFIEISNSTIKIENLDIDADEEKLYKIFESSCGEINYVKLKRNLNVCYGYIGFKNPQSVKTALELKSVMCDGKTIKISQAKPHNQGERKSFKKKKRNKHKFNKNRSHAEAKT